LNITNLIIEDITVLFKQSLARLHTMLFYAFIYSPEVSENEVSSPPSHPQLR